MVSWGYEELAESMVSKVIGWVAVSVSYAVMLIGKDVILDRDVF
jgi:hypothetical protein